MRIRLFGADPRRGQDCSTVRAGYRKFAVGAHVVFYRLVAGEPELERLLLGIVGSTTGADVAERLASMTPSAGEAS